ncbi:MAG TPA: ABC transporter ATP-binding protein, partial [Acidimicrobiia bacterium]|nr:ABC transporter ATP-binding protein [Acidimicrobiia bacterium]
FSLAAGETMVLLGESGSGKSVTSRAILRLYGGEARITGAVRFGEKSLSNFDERAMRKLRGSDIAMVPQDPTAALDPLRHIGAQLGEVLRVHGVAKGRGAARERVLALLQSVGIPDPVRVAKSYPHELSGGMRQRAMIAVAIACEPKVLIADEPTTALDVTVQAQVLELFSELQARLGMAMLMVTHDVGVAREIADRVAVMYAGRIVETGPTDAVLSSPAHPYSEGLLASVPRGQSGREERLRPIPGAPPSLARIPPGCPFHPRCPYVVERCRAERPPLAPVREPGREAACWRSDEVGRAGR